ncbi:MAG TPA: glycosyl transferase family 2 [Flavobacteriales bacterium]|nr:glycosyl transferase family 2 [Flavobacteriales bacterium]|tara:strand:- start:506 stop:2440 length:1935 start_codon:yes stop_codon:yes gene_type:complete
MSHITDLELHFGDRALFNKISFVINSSDRIGLVGKNGSGKSTLLKCIAGIQPYDGGKISFPSDYTIGYLPQDMDFSFGKTIFDEVKTTFTEVNDIQKEIDSITQEINHRTDYESESYLELCDKLNELNNRLSHLGGYDIEGEIESVLLGLGFSRNQFNDKTDILSGGWRMRIELAKILLKKPDLLLLDEPTNHLDILSIQWLEQFLLKNNKALLVVSHDKAFLDNVTNRTIEIIKGRIYDYKAPYSKFLTLRKERIEQQLAAYQNQQKKIKDTEKFIERFRAKATKATQVQSRIKQLEKMERIEIDETDDITMQFHFPPAPHSGKVVLELENVAKKYDKDYVFKEVNMIVERGEKLAFVGQNGQGKTTLSKIIVGELDYEGTVKYGHEVKIGYYAQNQADELDGEKTVFETIDEVAKGEIRKKVRNLLGAFMFSGDDADKKVKVLSGGERARVALCKLLLEPVNLLILDEPTNHLDIPSKEVLKKALKEYEGTMILVSHDRDFLQNLTNKTIQFENGRVKEFIGTVNEYLASKKLDEFTQLEQQKTTDKSENQKQQQSKESKNDYLQRKELEKKRRKLKNQIQKLELEITRLETLQKELNDKLMQPEQFSQELLNQHTEVSVKLEEAMQQWEKLTEQLLVLEDE